MFLEMRKFPFNYLVKNFSEGQDESLEFPHRLHKTFGDFVQA